MSIYIDDQIEEQLGSGKQITCEEHIEEALIVRQAREPDLHRISARIRDGEEAANRGEFFDGDVVITEAFHKIEAFCP